MFSDMNLELLSDVGRLMSPVTFDANEVVFQQGDAGHSLLVLESGSFQSFLAGAGGKQIKLSEMRPGEVIGELSLLGHGKRTATVRASEPSVCWQLERAAFDVLRNDARTVASEVARRIGWQAVERLLNLYERVGATIVGTPLYDPRAFFDWQERDRPATTEYLASTLFFQNFTVQQVSHLTHGLRQLYCPRDTVVVPSGRVPSALLLVVRGAVETSMRGEHSARRLRLAGPGRAVGQIGLLGDRAYVHRVESRAREHTVLLELPWPRVHELLTAEDKVSRRFANAVWTDTVRAVQYGEHPIATLSSSASDQR